MNRIIEANFLPPVEEAEEKARILIIDDSRDLTYSAKRALERTRRYSVWEENDPAKAHQTAQRVKPDLILLDIAMPETDGGEVAARIESDPTLHRTPIVFLTGLVTKAEARSGLRIQGHPFLAKPISVPDLVLRFQVTEEVSGQIDLKLSVTPASGNDMTSPEAISTA
jgi:CheY-like chemotaxis protein